MNDDRNIPAPESAPPAGPPVAEQEQVRAPRPPRVRGRAWRVLTVALPVVLVLGVIGAGIGYIDVTVDKADKSAPTKVWQKSDAKESRDPAEHAAEGRTDTELSKKLLPVPVGYHLGPDVDEYGNDGELSAQQATALLKSVGQGLSGSARRQMEKQIDRLGLKGLAARSYASDADDLVIETYVMSMKDRRAVIDLYKTDIEHPLGDPGPKVAGHKKAMCFQSPKDKKTHMRSLECVAYEGEVFVRVTAYGSEPFGPSASAVASMVGDQLDHIASPGKYV